MLGNKIVFTGAFLWHRYLSFIFHGGHCHLHRHRLLTRLNISRENIMSWIAMGSKRCNSKSTELSFFYARGEFGPVCMGTEWLQSKLLVPKHLRDLKAESLGKGHRDLILGCFSELVEKWPCCIPMWTIKTVGLGLTRTVCFLYSERPLVVNLTEIKQSWYESGDAHPLAIS